jgi:hypothetical protein
MNNLICIFFGHKDDEVTLRAGTSLDIVVNDIVYAQFRRCKRCKQIYFQTTLDVDGDTL